MWHPAHNSVKLPRANGLGWLARIVLLVVLLAWLSFPAAGDFAAAQADETVAGAEVTEHASDPAYPPADQPVIEQTDPAVEDVPPPTPTPVPPPPETPTEVPAEAPTDTPTEMPTDIPTEEVTAAPTDEPTSEPTKEGTEASDESTPTETETETETPTPTPTAEPPVPFEPVMECIRPKWASEAVAGESEWGLLECSLRWETEQVSEVRAEARPRDAGWTVVLVSEETLAQDLPLSQEDHQLLLTDSNADDNGFLTARFVLGTRLACVASLVTALDIDLTASSNPAEDDESVLEETVLLEIDVTARQPPVPDLTGMSVSFAPVADSLTGSRVSAGVVTISFEDAPERCGWSASIAFTDFVAGDFVIPAAQLVALSASGVEGIDVSGGDGVIWITVPTRDSARSTSGIITINTELDLGSFKPEGSYATTVTVELSLLQ